MGQNEKGMCEGASAKWEALCVRAAGWGGVDVHGYLDALDLKAFRPQCYAWTLDEGSWINGLAGLARFARLMAFLHAPAPSEVVLEDWRVAVLAGGPLALTALLRDGAGAADRVIDEQRAANSSPSRPCTCGEAGGLAGAHNPGARGCLANSEEEEERLLVTEVRARADKATKGPFDVHRYDNEGGLMSYQLQQPAGEGSDALVLCAFDDDENPRAARDADFYASARADVHHLTDLVVSLRANITWLVAERVALWKALRCVPGSDLVEAATARRASLDAERDAVAETERKAERYSPHVSVLRRSPLATALVSNSVSAHHAADAFEVEVADLRSQIERLLANDARPRSLTIHPSPESPLPSIFHDVDRFVGANIAECVSPSANPAKLDDVRRDVDAAIASLELLDDEEKVEEGGYDEAVEAAATFAAHIRRLAAHADRLVRERGVDVAGQGGGR